MQARAADKWARAGSGLGSAGVTGRARRSDPKRVVRIRFHLIKHGSPDLRRTPKI
jgi:hypothetical protein